MQYKAGYILSAIAETISKHKASLDKSSHAGKTELGKINGILKYVSSFDVDWKGCKQDLDFNNLHPVLATINNIITRGLPTIGSILLKKKFVDIKLSKQIPNENIFKFESEINFDFEKIFNLLHIVEPDLNIERERYGGNLGSNLEWQFLVDKPFLKQILQSQRDFATINARLAGGRSVDFSFSTPYLYWENNRYEKKGIIIEIDGHKSHFLSAGKYYDSYRDETAIEENFETVRFTGIEINANAKTFVDLFNMPVYQKYQNNYSNKIEACIKEYSLLFIPFAVARIQKTLLELFLANSTLLDNSLSIAIIERDLPCGALAIKNLQELFFNINELLDENQRLAIPEITLTIFQTSKWVFNQQLHLDAIIKNETDEEYLADNNFDIILDHSILRRSNIYNEPNLIHNKAIRIRTSHYDDTSIGISRRVYCARLLQYRKLVNKLDDGSYTAIESIKEPINYFVQNIFRKVKFKDGQLPIISRALQQMPVIGLLPTGGGKSLAYQLPALLQPGLCLVIDPIKSLMEDQVRVLHKNWIDCCDYINSNDNQINDNQVRIDYGYPKLVNFRLGETMFLFVSPERLVIKEFRNAIKKINLLNFGLAFSYCVIDEVHCVSEWGHDFRTTYLMLGKNLQNHAFAKNNKIVTLIGLTATASFDVLTDIERELNIESQDIHDAVIAIDNTIRPELFFNYVENERRETNFSIRNQTLKDNNGAKKQGILNDAITNIVDTLNSIDDEVIDKGLNLHFDEFEIESNNGGKNRENIKKSIVANSQFELFQDLKTLIFCPHVKGSFGITQEANLYPRNSEIFENLIIDVTKKGYFMGGSDVLNPNVIRNAQRYFLKFVDGNTNYMVCTKAFGMGIDVENIRSVFHFNYSSSPESFIQEAGRAGRDKAKAICTTIIDRNIYYTFSSNIIMKYFGKGINNLNARRLLRALFSEYDNYHNRIFTKYYDSIDQLVLAMHGLGIILDLNSMKNDVIEFNQDKAVHEYFHTNSFKGNETEKHQLNRLLEYKTALLNNGNSMIEYFNNSNHCCPIKKAA